MDDRDGLFLVVTAMGREPGIAPLTRALHGVEVPKALAMVARSGSLLQQTLTSLQPLAPPRRTYVLVPEEHAERARAQVGAWPGTRVLAVADEDGTAAMVMQILAEILSVRPEADLIVASADAYMAKPAPFVQALAAARLRLGMVPAVVLGACATRPTALDRWLLPGTRLAENLSGIREGELPATEEEARRLMAQGAAWNTYSCITRARYYWELLARELPMQAEPIMELWRMGCPVTETLARVVTETARGETRLDHFEVLLRERCSIALALVAGSGFSMWGSFEEVLHSLRNPLERAWLLSRLSGDEPRPLSPLPLELFREAPTAKL